MSEQWNEGNENSFEPEKNGEGSELINGFEFGGHKYTPRPGTLEIWTYSGTDSVFNHALTFADIEPDAKVPPAACFFPASGDTKQVFVAFLNFAIASGCEVHLNVPHAPEVVRKRAIRAALADLPKGKLFYSPETWGIEPPTEE